MVARALVASVVVVVVVVAVVLTSASAASTASDIVYAAQCVCSCELSYCRISSLGPARYNRQIRAARRCALDCLYAAPCEALRPVLKGTNLWMQ